MKPEGPEECLLIRSSQIPQTRVSLSGRHRGSQDRRERDRERKETGLGGKAKRRDFKGSNEAQEEESKGDETNTVRKRVGERKKSKEVEE